MAASVKVTHSLRVLGLSPDATLAEARTAFRNLARTCHPDVVGKQGARKFEQIVGAYTFLKSLTEDELQENGLVRERRDEQPVETARTAPSLGTFRWGWEKALTWVRKRRKRVTEENAWRERQAREAEKRAAGLRTAAVEAVLSRGERALAENLARLERDTLFCDTRGLALRLASDMPQVRHLALSHLGALVNHREMLDAVAVLLRKWDIDDKTARLAADLPFSPESRRALVQKLAVRASAMPNTLLTSLLLRDPPADRDVLELYLQHASPSGASLLLRQWPRGPFVSVPVLRRLLARDDGTFLINVLSTMKQRFAVCPAALRDVLTARLSHPNMAVRVWSKTLIAQASSVKG
ncbi:MAG: DnaJ domain-containing protein [Synergistaceae bacterium]|nr:DnaJ domain-containing protein [Synergistaceae bacterium]